MTIIIGIGSGRTGTQSLAHLINCQRNSLCFHELNPACMKWKGSEVTVRSMLREFEDIIMGKTRQVTIDYTSPHRDKPLDEISKKSRINIVGDIGFYYLNYVPMLCSMEIDIRIPCIIRDKHETIQSYIKKMESPAPGRIMRFIQKVTATTPYRNHWIEHDGKKWEKDPKWDKCYPKYNAPDLTSAISMYWDDYYRLATRFEKAYPKKVRIFDIETLNTVKGQEEILNFCGFYDDLVTGDFHSNRS